MSAPAKTEESGSIWSILNIVFAVIVGGFALFWGGALMIGVIGQTTGSKDAGKNEAPPPAAAAESAPAAPAATAEAAAAPAAAGEVMEITLKPDTNNPLAYDIKEFNAKAGATIKLTFENIHPTLPQPHNFVIGKLGVDKGKMLGLAMAAMTLVDKGYLPESEDILAHTKLLQPNETQTIEFVLPTAGEYHYICTFPGHGAIMNGVVKVQ